MTAPSMHRLLMVAALADGPAGSDAYAQWRERIDLQAIDHASQRMLPSLQRHLADDALATQIKHVLRFTWLRSQLLISAAHTATAALESAGVPTMLVKGAAVLHHTGWDVARRPMDDIDIAVPTARAVDAAGALQLAGFTSAYAAVLQAQSAAFTSSLHAVGFVSATHAEVDLHWHVLKESVRAGADDEFWAAATAAQLRGQPTLAPSREDTLLQVIANSVDRHATTALQWSVDAASLLQGGAIDWDVVVGRARRHQLSAVCGRALATLHEFRPAQIPTSVIARLRRDASLHVPARLPLPAVVRDDLAAARRAARHGERIGPIAVWGAARARRRALAAAATSAPPLEVGTTVTCGHDAAGHPSPYLTAGWHYAEPHGTWSRDRRSVIRLPLAEPIDGPLVVVVRLVPFLAAGSQRRRLRIRIDGALAADIRYVGDELRAHDVRLAVPPRPARTEVAVSIDVIDPVTPRAAGFNADIRRLGVNLAELRVERA